MTDHTFPELAAEYAQLWDGATIRPEHAAEITQAAAKLNSLKTQFYDPVSAATNVPWYVIGLIHCLEAGFNTNTHLHNGDPLGHQTTHVPAGRPPTPPFDDWAHSAIDALTQKGLKTVPAWNIERIAFELERYNGWGYRDTHPEVKTPY